MKTWLGAGITPIAIYKGKLYVLLGREASGKDKGKYSDFAGGVEPGDKSPKETALREAYEESMCFLGTKTEMKKKMKRITPDNATTFVLFIQYNENLPKLFENVYKYIKLCGGNIKKGYLEKDTVKWFPVKQSQPRGQFRNFFQGIYKILLKHKSMYKHI
jgi:hypothetical protein